MTKKIILPAFALILTLSVISHAFYISGTFYSTYLVGLDVANFIIQSTMDLIAAPTPGELFRQLFQTHAHHVLVGMQLVNLGSYYLLGHVNFQVLNILGTVYLCIPALIMIFRFKKNMLEFIFISAVIFPLILSPGHSSCAINQACSGNHYLGFSLAIISLSFFSWPQKTIKKYIGVILAAEIFLILAVLSSAAALCLIPVAFFVIAIGFDNPRPGLFIHALISFLICTLYIYSSQSVEGIENISGSLTEWIKIILLILLFFLSLLGSFLPIPDVDSMIGPAVSIITGASMICASAILMKKHWLQIKSRPELLFFASGFVLTLAMAGLISLARFYSFGSPRYVFYACFAVAFLLLFILSIHRARTIHQLAILAGISAIYYLAALKTQQTYLADLRWTMDSCRQSWLDNKRACGVMIGHQKITLLLQEAEQKGVLRLEH